VVSEFSRQYHDRKTSRHVRYRVREQSLKTLGFRTYKEYLNSNLWKTLKVRLIGQLCQICKVEKAYTFHHVTYSIPAMIGELPDQLIPICKRCHYAGEFQNAEKILDGKEIDRRLRKRARSKTIRPRCRCCGEIRNHIGRDDICMGCYKRYGPSVHIRAANRDNEAMANVRVVIAVDEPGRTV